MKTSNLLTAVLPLLLGALSLTAQAEDPRYAAPMQGYGYNAAPARGLFGLPVPQQWSGYRNTGTPRMATPTGYSTGYGTARNASNCPNGQCGLSQSQVTNYGFGQSQNGNCANGQCSTSRPQFGQYENAAYQNGRSSAGACANGRCPTGSLGSATNAYPRGGYQQGFDQGRVNTGYRGAPTDPFRRSGALSDDNEWVQRTPIAPLNDAFDSRYRQDDLDLRSEYFGSDSRRDFEPRQRTQPGSRNSSDDWNSSPRRSLQAPVESRSGVARF